VDRDELEILDQYEVREVRTPLLRYELWYNKTPVPITSILLRIDAGTLRVDSIQSTRMYVD